MTTLDISQPFDTVSRPCPTVTEPSREILDHSKLFTASNKINIQVLSDHFVKEGRLHIPDIIQIITTAAQIFRTEHNVLDIQDEVRVAGDLHGFTSIILMSFLSFFMR